MCMHNYYMENKIHVHVVLDQIKDWFSDLLIIY